MLEGGGGFWSHISQKWQQPKPSQASTPVSEPITDGNGDPWQALD